MEKTSIRHNAILDLTYTAIFTVIIAICSWITVPGPVPFTMQTFGVFLAVGVLGGKRGTVSVLVYLLLGLIGAPVFAGFSGGIGALLGVTGGYLTGFLLSALAMWLFEKLIGRKLWVLAVSMIAGLLICYTFGTAWFMIAYAHKTGPIGLGSALLSCVVPFIIPDLLKIALALFLSKKLSSVLKINGKL